MLQETLQHVSPLCDALEKNINDGDEATIAEQAAELVMWVQTLQGLFDVEPANPRTSIQSIDDTITSLQSARKSIMTDVEKRIADGEDVQGFGYVTGKGSRTIEQYSTAIIAMGLVGVDRDKCYEKKELGVPAIEKLLKAHGLNPDEREAVMGQFVTVKPGKAKLEVV